MPIRSHLIAFLDMVHEIVFYIYIYIYHGLEMTCYSSDIRRSLHDIIQGSKGTKWTIKLLIRAHIVMEQGSIQSFP